MDTSKFNKAKIHKITDVNYTKSYIGSTCEELSQRMARHRYMYNQHTNRGKESYRSACLMNLVLITVRLNLLKNTIAII